MKFTDAFDDQMDKSGETSFSGKVEYSTFGYTYDAGTKKIVNAIKKAFDPNYYADTPEDDKKLKKMQKYLEKFNIKKESPYDFSIEPHKNEKGESTGSYVVSINTETEGPKKRVIGVYSQLNLEKALKDPKYMYYLLTNKGTLDD